MQIYFNVGETIDGKSVFVCNDLAIEKIISECLSGVVKEILSRVDKEDALNCYVCILSLVNLHREEPVQIMLACSNRDSKYIFTIKEGVEPNIIWEEILSAINQLTTEIDRISSIVQ